MREARRDGETEAEVRRPNITRYLFDATICTVSDFMCRLVSASSRAFGGTAAAVRAVFFFASPERTLLRASDPDCPQ